MVRLKAKKVFLITTLQVFLLCSSATSLQAQTEHYVGLAVSNVIGPSYTLRHNRWTATADAGWLAGFNGMYASMGGMYRILNMNQISKFFKIKERQDSSDVMINVRLGLFAQDYYSPSVRQKRWADKLAYVAPFGCNMLVELYFHEERLPNWNFAMRFRGPVYFTTKEHEDIFSKGTVATMLATFQIVVQRRF
ncbi:MAG: hypothetical protein LBK18_03655 [Prevotellaceae bacterium]|jgi:hypothetical protein|nr:hypothetical protein [Prevotellaceae bacterium]